MAGALIRTLSKGWIPKRVHPETGESGPTFKQLKFLLLPNLEAFYGGAAGGGKSDALLMGAAMFLDMPDYNAIIFRKTIRSLQRKGGLIPRSKEWWMDKAKWSGDTLTWTFPTKDRKYPATVSFGYLNHEDDYVLGRLWPCSKVIRETVNFMGFAELVDHVSASTAYLLHHLDVQQGEVLSDGRGQGSFERVMT